MTKEIGKNQETDISLKNKIFGRFGLISNAKSKNNETLDVTYENLPHDESFDSPSWIEKDLKQPLIVNFTTINQQQQQVCFIFLKIKKKNRKMESLTLKMIK